MLETPCAVQASFPSHQKRRVPDNRTLHRQVQGQVKQTFLAKHQRVKNIGGRSILLLCVKQFNSMFSCRWTVHSLWRAFARTDQSRSRTTTRATRKSASPTSFRCEHFDSVIACMIFSHLWSWLVFCAQTFITTQDKLQLGIKSTDEVVTG